MDTNGWALQEASSTKEDDKLIRQISVKTKHSGQKTIFLCCILIFISFTGHILWSWNLILLAIITITLLFIFLHSSVSKETLVLISSLGVQISSEYLTGQTVVKFIPFKAVQDIIIHEAVTMHKVVYYLAVLLQHQNGGERKNSLVPVFVHSMPRLDKLQEIHSLVHKMWDFEKHRLESFQEGGDSIQGR